jgi:hypothetical protein
MQRGEREACMPLRDGTGSPDPASKANIEEHTAQHDGHAFPCKPLWIG